MLQRKQFYIDLFRNYSIDTNKIYELTKAINDLLHHHLNINDFKQRMMFTAAALVSECYGANLSAIANQPFNVLKEKIKTTLSNQLATVQRENPKIQYLKDVFDAIKVNAPEETIKIRDLIKNIVKISQSINSNHWRGEDVRGIFFNEFSRYKGKSDNGQVFTPQTHYFLYV